MNILTKIHLNPHIDTTLIHQLTQQIHWLIATGQINPEDYLPSVRKLAQQLGINMHTVRSAYLRLEADGMVETHQGKGTRVLPYDPRRMAQFAGMLRSHTVGVIIPSMTNPFYHPFLQGIESIASHNHTLLFACTTHDDPGEARRYYAQLAAKQVDGIILASHDDSPFLLAQGEYLRPDQPGLPLVAVDWPDSTGYTVQIDLENAGYQATRHLLEHDHRQVGLISHVLDLPNVRPLEQGYLRALHEAGLPTDEGLMARVHGFDTTAGAEGARSLLALHQPPGAIFAIADLLAIGAMRYIQQAGLKIPQELAIVGFNDIPMAAWVNPPLTTLSAPAFQMGQEAMRTLQSLIAGEPPACKRIELPTKLVIRQSCGAHASQNSIEEVS